VERFFARSKRKQTRKEKARRTKPSRDDSCDEVPYNELSLGITIFGLHFLLAELLACNVTLLRPDTRHGNAACEEKHG
jgi:hypothetical protein